MDIAFSSNDNFGEDDFRPQEKCRRCRKNSELMCLRCGDCYCSKKCQDIDWPQHRYICFPKPPLVKINTVFNDDNVPDLGVVQPVHLNEQLRVMANVCREFMQQLEENTNSKIDKTDKQLVNGSKNSNTRTVFDDTVHVEKRPNKILTERNNSNKKAQELQSIINCSSRGKKLPLKNESDESSISSIPSVGDKLEDQTIYLTSFRSTNRVGVCPKVFEIDGSYQEILETVDKYGQNAPILKHMPDSNAFVISNRAGKFTRAKIVPYKEINASRIRVEFIDYGNLGFRKLTELREITPEIINLPTYIRIVQLSKVDLVGYDQNVLKFLSSFEKKYYMLKNVLGPQNTISVELYDVENGDKINELISKGCSEREDLQNPSTSNKSRTHDRNAITKNNKPEQENSFNRKKHETENLLNQKNLDNSKLQPVMEAPFEERIFPKTTRNKKAFILDVTLAEHGYMACMFQEHKPILKQIQTYLRNLDKSDKPYKPQHGEYVIAQYEGDWYRGKVIGVLPNKQFEVSYIDFLNEGTLTSDEIRRYPEDLTIPCYTTLCVIADLPKKTSNDIKEFLKNEICINDVIEINRVVDIVDDRVAWIECHEIIDRMYEKNLF